MSILGKCSIELEGVFDLKAARRVEEALGRMEAGGTVEVDLTRVREFHDVGLAILAQSVRRSRDSIQVDVRGLRDRQHRLLRYLGIELGATTPASGTALH
jgi:anti-anti-sigma regulatory factor